MQDPPHGQPHRHSHHLLLPALLGMKQQQHQQLQCQLLLHLHHCLLGPLQLTFDCLSGKLTRISAGLQVCTQQLWH